MIQSCTDFTVRSKSSIDSFLGKWSLETAISHIKEMSRLVSLSQLMETLVEQIHKLMKAITTLLQVISTKIQTMMQSSGLDSMVDSVADAAADLVAAKKGDFTGKPHLPCLQWPMSSIGIGPLSGDGGRVNLNSILIALLTASIGLVRRHGFMTIMSSVLSSWQKDTSDDFLSIPSRLTSVSDGISFH